MGTIVPAVDVDEDGAATAFTTTDGCSPLTNAAAVAGKIALVERGCCGFAVKANACKRRSHGDNYLQSIGQRSGGASGNGWRGSIPFLFLASACRVPTASRLWVNPDATGFIGKDSSIRAGADAAGKVRLFMPNPVQGGSSGSHYDSIAFKNLLMEPAINADLTHDLIAPDDLTLELMRDVGWFPDADLDGLADNVDCEPNSDFAPTVVIGGCDSGVTNFLFTSGCTISDLIAHIAATSKNHGKFVSWVAQLGNALVANGIITPAQKDAIESCAAGANIP